MITKLEKAALAGKEGSVIRMIRMIRMSKKYTTLKKDVEAL